jgi:CHASE2 domain-containing sensor protein
MKHPLSKPGKPAIIVFTSVILISLLVHLLQLTHRVDLAILDTQFRLLHKYSPASVARDDRIVIIGIDEKSRAMVPEPFSLWHRHLGKFLHAMAVARPAVVGMDILLPERSYDSLLKGYDLALRKGIIDARQHTRVIYGRSILSDGSIRRILPRFLFSIGGHRQTGFVLWQLDADRIVRRFSEAFGQPPRNIPTLSGQMARSLGITPGSGYIDYSLGKPFTYIPFYKVLQWYDNNNKDILTRKLGNRIVFLGTVLSFQDRHYIPVNLAGWENHNGNRVPGVLIHGQALRSMINQRLLNHVSGKFMLLLVLTSAVAWFFCKRIFPGIYTFLAFILVAITASTLSLVMGTIVPISSLLIAGAIGFLGRTAYESSRKILQAARTEMEQEKLRSEIALAGEIQRGLLPATTSATNPISAINVPAQVVSGDFYDYFRIDAKRILFNLGDVSGKGLKAALTMSRTHGLFHYLAREIHKPSELLARINHELSERSTHGMFVTMTVGIYNADNGQLCLSNAGHMHSLVRTANGEFREYPADGPPLGILPDTKYTDNCFHLGNDRLYLYSDGISETLERYSEGHEARTLQEIIELHHSEPVAQQAESIVNIVKERNSELMDDITLLILDPTLLQ